MPAPCSHPATLCLTVRYPFDLLPLQDPNFSFPHPFDDRFDSITMVTILDGALKGEC
jgi:hypothetical protein